MADTKVAFELVAPERLLASIDADMVVIPGADGDFGVLPNHAPLMSLLRPGVISVYQGDKIDRRLFVAGGFAEVRLRASLLGAPLSTVPINIGAAGIIFIKHKCHWVLQCPWQQALFIFGDLFAFFQDDHILAQQINTANMAIQVNTQTWPIQTGGHLLHMG